MSKVTDRMSKTPNRYVKLRQEEESDYWGGRGVQNLHAPAIRFITPVTFGMTNHETGYSMALGRTGYKTRIRQKRTG